MQNSFFIALFSLLFFTACKNENPQTTTAESAAIAVPVKAGNFADQGTLTPTPETTDATVAELVEKKETDTKEAAKPLPKKTTGEKAAAAENTKTTTSPKPVSEAPQPSANEAIKPAAPVIAETVEAPPSKTKEATQTIEKQKVVKAAPATEEAPAMPQPPSHSTFDELLRKHVSNTGKVDYAGIKNEKAKLDAYLKTLQNNPPQSDWAKKEKLAFWINAYNAFTMKLIVDNYPVSSITKLEGGKPWDKKWIKIGDKTYSLNNIENDIIRPRFKEPRIHFAVNCAAKSCPPLLNRAWTAANLESNFAKRAKAFVNNSQYNSISSDKVQVSKIFEWYGEDFGNLIKFLNQYAETKISPDAKVEYKEYDWALNN